MENRGYTFQSYIRQLRIDDACRLIEQNYKITNKEIAEQIGFSSDSAFSRAFTTVKGISPYIYKKEIEKRENSKNVV